MRKRRDPGREKKKRYILIQVPYEGRERKGRGNPRSLWWA